MSLPLLRLLRFGVLEARHAVLTADALGPIFRLSRDFGCGQTAPLALPSSSEGGSHDP